jgi:hypothetical protein
VAGVPPGQDRPAGADAGASSLKFIYTTLYPSLHPPLRQILPSILIARLADCDGERQQFFFATPSSARFKLLSDGE